MQGMEPHRRIETLFGTAAMYASKDANDSLEVISCLAVHLSTKQPFVNSLVLPKVLSLSAELDHESVNAFPRAISRKDECRPFDARRQA